MPGCCCPSQRCCHVYLGASRLSCVHWGRCIVMFAQWSEVHAAWTSRCALFVTLSAPCLVGFRRQVHFFRSFH